MTNKQKRNVIRPLRASASAIKVFILVVTKKNLIHLILMCRSTVMYTVF